MGEDQLHKCRVAAVGINDDRFVFTMGRAPTDRPGRGYKYFRLGVLTLIPKC